MVLHAAAKCAIFRRDPGNGRRNAAFNPDLLNIYHTPPEAIPAAFFYADIFQARRPDIAGYTASSAAAIAEPVHCGPVILYAFPETS